MTTKDEILSVKVHRFWDSTVPITCHMKDLMTCTACGTSLFNAKQVCNTDSPRRMWSPNSSDALPAFWSVPAPTGSGTSSVFNLYTQTHSKYRSDILMILILQQQRAPSYKHSEMKQMVLSSDSYCWTAFTFYRRPITHWFSLQWNTPKQLGTSCWQCTDVTTAS